MLFLTHQSLGEFLKLLFFFFFLSSSDLLPISPISSLIHWSNQLGSAWLSLAFVLLNFWAEFLAPTWRVSVQILLDMFTNTKSRFANCKNVLKKLVKLSKALLLRGCWTSEFKTNSCTAEIQALHQPLAPTLKIKCLLSDISSSVIIVDCTLLYLMAKKEGGS